MLALSMSDRMERERRYMTKIIKRSTSNFKLSQVLWSGRGLDVPTSKLGFFLYFSSPFYMLPC